MNLNRCKFEFSNGPKQFYNFVNAKRSRRHCLHRYVLTQWRHRWILKLLICLPSTYSSAVWSNSNYPNPLNRANCIFTPVITESSFLRDLATSTTTNLLELSSIVINGQILVRPLTLSTTLFSYSN